MKKLILSVAILLISNVHAGQFSGIISAGSNQNFPGSIGIKYDTKNKENTWHDKFYGYYNFTDVKDFSGNFNDLKVRYELVKDFSNGLYIGPAISYEYMSYKDSNWNESVSFMSGGVVFGYENRNFVADLKFYPLSQASISSAYSGSFGSFYSFGNQNMTEYDFSIGIKPTEKLVFSIGNEVMTANGVSFERPYINAEIKF